MRYHRVVQLLALCAGSAVALSAQQQSGCVFDTAAHRDTSVILLRVRAYDARDSLLAPEFQELLSAVFRAHLSFSTTVGAVFYPFTTVTANTVRPRPGPMRITVTSFTPRPGPGPGSETPRRTESPEAQIYAAIQLRITDGRLGELGWAAHSNNAPTDSAIVRALQEAVSTGELRQLEAALSRSSVSMPLQVQFLSGDTTVAQPVARFRVPMMALSRAAVPVSAPMPHFPPGLRNAMTGGEVHLSFVVDEEGKVVPSTLWVVSATHEAFASAAVTAVMGERFAPAMIATCPARQLVEQRVMFVIGHR